VRFYLGTHRPHWLGQVDVPLFVSHRTLGPRRSLPVATCDWALDSGGFSELSIYGEWRTTEAQYIAAVRRYAEEIGRLEWVAPMDWMVEPHIREMTGLTTREHQWLTVMNFARLREALGPLVVPVVQGWEEDDYARHVEMYDAAGVDLGDERLVGVGSVCRRPDARRILRPLGHLRIHGFGVKGSTLEAVSDVLTSADSMAWSYQARRNEPLPGCTHRHCNGCQRYALRWRTRLLQRFDQLRLWEGACAI
jgi:hypothetical protein